MRPKKKGRGIAASFMKAEPDATRRNSLHDYDRNAPAAPSTMDEHSVQDIVEHMGGGAERREAAAMTEWNPSDPFSADNPAVAKKLRAEELARKRKLR